MPIMHTHKYTHKDVTIKAMYKRKHLHVFISCVVEILVSDVQLSTIEGYIT